MKLTVLPVEFVLGLFSLIFSLKVKESAREKKMNKAAVSPKFCKYTI
jgi:hypothetical protein